jgi:hypothetical protein
MSSASQRQYGLARPELLFLLSILLLVLSIALPVAISWRNHERAVVAYSELHHLVHAADLFHREYQVWPVPDASGRTDVRFGPNRANGDVLRILKAESGPGNEEHRANPQQIDFLLLAGKAAAATSFRTSASGDVLDPWGTPYHMVFDANYDNIVAIPESILPDVVGEGVVMWSSGPDRRSDTADDLRSWGFGGGR